MCVESCTLRMSAESLLYQDAGQRAAACNNTHSQNMFEHPGIRPTDNCYCTQMLHLIPEPAGEIKLSERVYMSSVGHGGHQLQGTQFHTDR